MNTHNKTMKNNAIFFKKSLAAAYLTCCFYLFTGSLAPQPTYLTLTDYIDKYKGIAIMEMQRTGIPASITLAQGIIESNYGNSSLATKSNNHFGIKCRNTWKGASVRLHDDKPNECFRKYDHPYESFIDHSYLLTSSERYAPLFKYKPTDYRSWAQGLQKAHYASSKRYARVITSVIDFYGLHYYDTSRYQKYTIHPVYVNVVEQYAQKYDTTTYATQQITDAQTIPVESEADTSSFTLLTQLMNTTVKTQYTVQPGETMYGIAKKFGTTVEAIQALNGIVTTQLKAGQVISIFSP